MNDQKETTTELSTDPQGRLEALVRWIDDEMEYHYQQRESINLDADDPELECWGIHDRGLLRLGQIKRAVLALRELVELKDMKDRLDDYGFPGTEAMTDASEDYARRKPAAWAEARAAVST